MSRKRRKFNRDEQRDQVIKVAPSNNWFSITFGICLIILGIIFKSIVQEQEIYFSVYMAIITFIGLTWLILTWIDLNRVYRKFNQLIVFPSPDTDPEWTYYTYMVEPHSYSFYLKVGLTIFCLGHIVLITIIITSQIFHVIQDSECKNLIKLTSSCLDFIVSILQLIFIQFHSNILINRFSNLARFGLMTLIAVAILKWITSIIEDAKHEFAITQHIETLKLLSTSHHHNQSLSIKCNPGQIFQIDLSPTIPYLYPFTIEFNLLLAIQWFLTWELIGHYVTLRRSEIWFVNEHAFVDDNIPDDLASTFYLAQSSRGLFAGLICLIVSLISLLYYFSVESITRSTIATSLVKIEDIFYLLSSLVSLAIVWFDFSYLELTKRSAVGSTDLVLLFFPLPFYCISGFIKLYETKDNQYLDLSLHMLTVIQPIVQTLFINYGRFRYCFSVQLLEDKPGRQIVTFLIMINLVLWLSGTFRTKARLHDQITRGMIAQLIILNICQPFILFYRYHSSVCLANIWKICFERYRSRMSQID